MNFSKLSKLYKDQNKKKEAKNACYNKNFKNLTS